MKELWFISGLVAAFGLYLIWSWIKDTSKQEDMEAADRRTWPDEEMAAPKQESFYESALAGEDMAGFWQRQRQEQLPTKPDGTPFVSEWYARNRERRIQQMRDYRKLKKAQKQAPPPLGDADQFLQEATRIIRAQRRA